jgi:ADP-heptose:LPS heptosyltransferase
LAQQVFQNHPGLEMVSNTPDPNRHLGLAVRRMREVVQSFRGEPWCALFTAWNCRSRVALAAMLAGNGVRAGFTVAPPLLHLPISFDRDLSQIANNLRIPELLGHSVPDGLEPRVYFNASDLDHALNLLGPDTERPIVILITRTSGGQPTAWPDDRFLAVAKHLIAAHGCRILFPGTAADAASLSRLTDSLGGDAQSLAGKTSIPQLAAVCAMSDLAVSVDTGGMHVARAQSLPVVVIAPGWQNSVEWMPLEKSWARILKGPWFPPPPPRNYAIEEVTVEDVIAASEDLLREFSPSPAAREQRMKRSVETRT